MPWFVTREEAEAFFVTIIPNPNYSYSVSPNGCGPGWGVEVRDADGTVITEVFNTGAELDAMVAERRERRERAHREAERTGRKPNAERRAKSPEAER